MKGIAAIVLMAIVSGLAHADEALLAVAANFSEAATRLATDFEASTGHEITISTGSTGKLYAQILNGAPYDIFLAADQARPSQLQESGRVIAGSRFTYALGQLVLWSAEPGFVDNSGSSTLQQPKFRSIAIANPALAPYGAAARQAMQSLDIWDSLRSKVVMGENVGQAHALVITGNAKLGFVALSSIMSPRNKQEGSHWVVSDDLYSAIRQDAVLLQHGSENIAARGFLEFLKTDSVRATIESLGYGVE